nr:CRISPR-associated endonuclease Cas1 [Spirulina major]
MFKGIAPEQLSHIQTQLNAATYGLSPVRGIHLRKENGGKRLIGIPTVRDRIVQRWLLEDLYPELEHQFADCSYAYRPGRSIQQAVQHLYLHYQYQPAWVIKADITQFFDSLCWGLLMNSLEQMELTQNHLALLHQSLTVPVILRGQRLRRTQGVVQGSVLSGALANLYLSEFDARCLQQGMNLVRYGDDFVVVCHSAEEARIRLAQIQDGLTQLYLRLNSEKTAIAPPDQEFTFLGHRFVNGKVYAPPPPSPLKLRDGYWVLSPSGVPRWRIRRPERLLPAPPKVCALRKQPPPSVVANPNHLFSDLMTTLYITDQGAYLKAQQYQFQVFHRQELRCKIPINQVSHVVLFGCCNLSHGAVRLALARRIPVLYLSQRGRYFGRLQTDGQAKVNYLSRQVEWSQDEEQVRNTAETIIRAKLQNSRVLLQRLNRRRATDAAQQAIAQLAIAMDNLPLAESLEALRGMEGNAAKLYFQGLGSLFKGDLSFSKRSKRPPTDPVNSLLSLGYTLLHQNLHSFIETLGLHPHFGNLHVPRDNHPALVSDLVEEFRALVVDSLVSYVVNKNIITAEDFTPADERGGVFLQPDALKRFLKHWEEKLHSEVTHPTTGHQVSLRRCFELQVREYIAALLGDVPAYRPMLWGK